MIVYFKKVEGLKKFIWLCISEYHQLKEIPHSLFARKKHALIDALLELVRRLLLFLFIYVNNDY